MAECFCGCGRKVRFRDRRANKAGRTIMTVLERLRAGRHSPPGRAGKRLSAEMDDLFLHYINQGEGLAQGCLATLHAGEPWGRAETRAVRQWRKQAKSVAQSTSSPLDVIQRIARRG